MSITWNILLEIYRGCIDNVNIDAEQSSIHIVYFYDVCFASRLHISQVYQEEISQQQKLNILFSSNKYFMKLAIFFLIIIESFW